MKIKHILIATDLSSSSECVWPHAGLLSSHLVAEVTVLHVDDTTTFDYGWSGEFDNYLVQAQELRADLLRRFAQHASDHGANVVAVEMAHGAIAREILASAALCKADLLVVATQGENRRETPLLGSTSRVLLRTSTIPILVVPAGSDPHEASEGLWHRMMACTDFSDDARRGCIVTGDLATTFGAEANFAHVIEPPRFGAPELIERLSMAGRGRIQKLQNGVVSSLVDRVNARTTHTIVMGSRVPETLIRAAMEYRADLITIPTHGRGALRALLLGSTSERLVEISPVPVLVFPRTYLDDASSGFEGTEPSTVDS